jgi:surface carbohydrate biosynthesis protein
MKKLIRVNGLESDVLIIDTVDSDFVIKCIPAEFSYSVVEVRKGIPYIPRLFFFIRLCARVSQFGLKNKALMSAIVDSINPKVIISFIDNSLIMGQLDSIFPHKLVISIQNGTRMSRGGFLNGSPNFMLPHYFSFGEYEKDVIKKYHIKCKEIYSVGSLRAGIFLDNYHDSILQTDSICLISQYWTITDDEVKNDYMEKLKCVYLNLLSWNRNHEYKIKIAMRSKKSETVYNKNESNFYSDKNITKKIELITRTNFSSYKAGYRSSIVITMDSTLGFELMGFGKKVLFCAMTMDKALQHKENINYIFHKMPDIVLLDNLTQQDFDNKMNVLIHMKDEEYLSQTEAARKYYMKCQKLPPHKTISDFIYDKVLI